jgi:hypothetical protein
MSTLSAKPPGKVTRFEQFRQQRVGRGVSGQRLQVQKKIGGGPEGGKMRAGTQHQKVVCPLFAKLRAKLLFQQTKRTTAVRPLVHDRSPGIREYSDRTGTGSAVRAICG